MSRRKLEINKRHCRHSELEKIYRNCKDAVMQLKLLAVLQVWDGLVSTDLKFIFSFSLLNTF